MRLLPAPDKRELLSNQEYPVSLPPDADALTLAPLRAGDMPAVMRIQAQCYSAIVPESLQSMSAKQQAAPGTCHAAWRQGALVGYLLALPVRALALPALDSPACTIDPAADALYLHDLALAPAARGGGVGQALVAHALAVGAQLGLRRALLVAIQGSAPYWARQGFAPLPPPSPDVCAKLASYGADAQLMQRPLQPG